MSQNPGTIQKSILIAIRHPTSGLSLFAQTLANYINSTQWVTKELQIKFCVLFLNTILDHYRINISETLLEDLQNRSIHFGIRLLKRYPQRGLEMLVNLIVYELVKNQKYSNDDLIEFYNEVFTIFFPEEADSLKHGVTS